MKVRHERPARLRLPNRREAVYREILYDDKIWTICAGFFEDGGVAEVFVDGAMKVGSQFGAVCDALVEMQGEGR